MSSCQHKANYPVVAENPQTVYSNTSIIAIEKVELTDSATTLYVKATFIPHYWIRIDSAVHLTAAGAVYPVIESEGIELSKEFWMPDSGMAHFTLYFAPMPANTVSLAVSRILCKW